MNSLPILRIYRLIFRFAAAMTIAAAASIAVYAAETAQGTGQGGSGAIVVKSSTGVSLSLPCNVLRTERIGQQLKVYFEIPSVTCEATFPIGTHYDYSALPATRSCALQTFGGLAYNLQQINPQDPLPLVETKLRDMVASLSAGTYDYSGHSITGQRTGIESGDWALVDVSDTFDVGNTLQAIERLSKAMYSGYLPYMTGATQGEETKIVSAWCLDASDIRRVWEALIAVKSYRNLIRERQLALQSGGS